jgi:hypothetical protein
LDLRNKAWRLRAYEFEAQPGVPLQLLVLEPRRNRERTTELRVLNHAEWQAAAGKLEETFEVTGLRSSVSTSGEPGSEVPSWRVPDELTHTLVLFAPRGAGLTAPNLNARGFIQFRRRFMLLGQTLDGMRVWDIRQAIAALGQTRNLNREELILSAAGPMTINLLLAGLFEGDVDGFKLTDVPAALDEGPDHLGLMKVLDLPALFAAATVGRINVNEVKIPDNALEYAAQVSSRVKGGQ